MAETGNKDGMSKKTIYIFLGIMVMVVLIGTITSYVRWYYHGIAFGHDFRFFKEAVQKFWLTGENLYENNIISTFKIEGYFYLNYFCILCFWMLLPLPFSFIIHLLITITMFYLILKKIETIYQE